MFFLKVKWGRKLCRPGDKSESIAQPKGHTPLFDIQICVADQFGVRGYLSIARSHHLAQY